MPAYFGRVLAVVSSGWCGYYPVLEASLHGAVGRGAEGLGELGEWRGEKGQEPLDAVLDTLLSPFNFAAESYEAQRVKSCIRKQGVRWGSRMRVRGLSISCMKFLGARVVPMLL